MDEIKMHENIVYILKNDASQKKKKKIQPKINPTKKTPPTCECLERKRDIYSS